MGPEEIRRWLDGRRAAEERERAQARTQNRSPESAIAQALALIALGGRLHGWPPLEDDVSSREDAVARAQWVRLRSVLLARDRAGGPDSAGGSLR